MKRRGKISKSPPGIKLQIGNLSALAAGVTFLPHDARGGKPTSYRDQAGFPGSGPFDWLRGPYWPGATSNSPSAAMTA